MLGFARLAWIITASMNLSSHDTGQQCARHIDLGVHRDRDGPPSAMQHL